MKCQNYKKTNQDFENLTMDDDEIFIFYGKLNNIGNTYFNSSEEIFHFKVVRKILGTLSDRL